MQNKSEGNSQAENYLNGTVFDCRAQKTIQTQGNIVIEMGANVLYMAPSLVLAPEFRVKAGGVFHGVGANQVAP